MKPRDWARIGCANLGNRVTHTKNYRERPRFLLHTRCCLLDVMVVTFRSSAKGPCNIF